MRINNFNIRCICVIVFLLISFWASAETVTIGGQTVTNGSSITLTKYVSQRDKTLQNQSTVNPYYIIQDLYVRIEGAPAQWRMDYLGANFSGIFESGQTGKFAFMNQTKSVTLNSTASESIGDLSSYDTVATSLYFYIDSTNVFPVSTGVSTGYTVPLTFAFYWRAQGGSGVNVAYINLSVIYNSSQLNKPISSVATASDPALPRIFDSSGISYNLGSFLIGQKPSSTPVVAGSCPIYSATRTMKVTYSPLTNYNRGVPYAFTTTIYGITSDVYPMGSGAEYGVEIPTSADDRLTKYFSISVQPVSSLNSFTSSGTLDISGVFTFTYY